MRNADMALYRAKSDGGKLTGSSNGKWTGRRKAPRHGA